MKFPASVDDFAALSELKSQLHLAIGVFDGVHLGHKAVIEAAVLSARRSGGISGGAHFRPAPEPSFSTGRSDPSHHADRDQDDHAAPGRRRLRDPQAL